MIIYLAGGYGGNRKSFYQITIGRLFSYLIDIDSLQEWINKMERKNDDAAHEVQTKDLR